VITALALLLFACVLVLLSHRTCTVALGLALCASIATSTAAVADDQVDFAAMARRAVVSAPPAALDFGRMAKRESAVAATPPVVVSFAAMAHRQSTAAPLVAKTSNVNWKYQHLDGSWRDHPQPGVSYPSLLTSQPTRSGGGQPYCVGGQCYLR
jgi:hypothetical protein